jgi:hypothetical protein
VLNFTLGLTGWPKILCGIISFFGTVLGPVPLLKGYWFIKFQRHAFFARRIWPKISYYKNTLSSFKINHTAEDWPWRAWAFYSAAPLNLELLEAKILTSLQSQFAAQFSERERIVRMAGEAATHGYLSGILSNLADCFPPDSKEALAARATAADMDTRVSAKKRLIAELNAVLAQREQDAQRLASRAKKKVVTGDLSPSVELVQTILFVLAKQPLSAANLESAVRRECRSSKIAFTSGYYQASLTSLLQTGEVVQQNGSYALAIFA